MTRQFSFSKDLSVPLSNGEVILYRSTTTRRAMQDFIKRVKEHGVYGEFGQSTLFNDTHRKTAAEVRSRMTECRMDNVCMKIISAAYHAETGRLTGWVIPFGPKAKLMEELVGRDEVVPVVLRSFNKNDLLGHAIDVLITLDYNLAETKTA